MRHAGHLDQNGEYSVQTDFCLLEAFVKLKGLSLYRYCAIDDSQVGKGCQNSNIANITDSDFIYGGRA